MKLFIAALMTLSTYAAQAKILGIYIGSIEKVSQAEFLTGKGFWKQIPNICKPYTRQQSFGFSAAADSFLRTSNISCPQAEITLDLEDSSFCQDQGGREIYSSPTVVSIKCF